MTREPLIAFEHVSMSYQDHLVLDDVSFTVPRSETTVLVGPSGAGKSTILRLLVGLLAPDAGRILVDGQSLTDLGSRELMQTRRRFGMLFQEGALFNSMTVLENVVFPLRHHTDLSPPEQTEIALAKLEAVGITGDLTRRSPEALSGGQRKRVGLARALALEPEIVLFDEPTSGLDPVTSAAIDELIRRMGAVLETTFLVITHDIHSCRTIAHHVGLLHQGKLLAFGPRDEVLGSKHPAVQQFFGRQSHGPLQTM